MIDLKYDFTAIEKKWQSRWKEEKTFACQNGDTSKPKFYGLVEFPYPSAAGLHVGHPRPYTAMDVIARKKRMDGYNVLFPIGYDAFGLPTENFAIKNHVHPAKVTKDNIANFTRQLHMLGYSFDWDRVVDTTDPGYYKWTQWIFLQLYKHGLAYKTTMPVNWCTSCKCVLANEEVVEGVCERCGAPVIRKEKSQWMLKITEYAQKLIDGLDTVDFIDRVKTQQRNWIGRSTGAEVVFKATTGEDIKVFTTRPDTLFGATYMVLSPEHALVRGWLAQEGVDLSTLSAVVGRGGIIPNIVAGGYLVDDNLADCLRNYPVFDHASNLGGLMARAFAQPLGIPAYIYDAVTSDEMVPEARVTGFKEVMRTSFCHVLNARATSHKYAETLGRRYEDMNLVVAHLGGGISISAHRHGRIIDSVSDDAGPFSPDRSGSLNMLYVVDLCYSGKYTKKDMLKKLRGEGGMSALLGTHDCREIERRIQAGDERAALVYKAQALQIAKGVGTLLGCFTELIDAVILTGGLAYSKMLTDMVIGYLHNLARVVVIPGENEMEALALGGLRLLRGEEPVHTFAPACDLSVIP